MTEPRTDLVLAGKYLVTMNDAMEVIEDGAVAIAGGRILELGRTAKIRAGHPGAELIAEEHGLIMPGLVNTHTHAAMACFRGLADDLPLMQWLQEYIFPVEAKLTSEIVYHSTLLSLCEMIKSGTTSFCDMYLFAADVARAAGQSGMRAWIGEVLYDFPSPNYGEIDNGFAYAEKLFAQYAGHDRITVTVDPHAVYTCSPPLLQKLGRMADEHQALYVIHLSETRDEVAACNERYGCSPVVHLENLGLLNERVVADHCVMVTDDEIRLLADRGVKVAHCAESNMKLASGTAPVPRMLAAGIRVGIGTDGSASNNDVDMFGEMNSVAKVHKTAAMDPTTMDAVTILHAATRGGAEVLGTGSQIGSLEPGRKADIIVLDMNRPHLTPVYNPLSHLVYAARGSDVIHSVIDGRIVMRDRRLLTLDEKEILAGMREIARDVRKMRAQ
jgi:5-methylthioadenosine/S-adenosylhomocysteine deaminase